MSRSDPLAMWLPEVFFPQSSPSWGFLMRTVTICRVKLSHPTRIDSPSRYSTVVHRLPPKLGTCRQRVCCQIPFWGKIESFQSSSHRSCYRHRLSPIGLEGRHPWWYQWWFDHWTSRCGMLQRRNHRRCRSWPYHIRHHDLLTLGRKLQPDSELTGDHRKSS